MSGDPKLFYLTEKESIKVQRWADEHSIQLSSGTLEIAYAFCPLGSTVGFVFRDLDGRQKTLMASRRHGFVMVALKASFTDRLIAVRPHLVMKGSPTSQQTSFSTAALMLSISRLTSPHSRSEIGWYLRTGTFISRTPMLEHIATYVNAK